MTDTYTAPNGQHTPDGRACPECGALVIGSNHRAQHQTLHGQLDAMHEQLVVLSRALRDLATETGHEDWYEGGEAPAVDGYVIGSGQLPAETRGGDD